MALTEEHARISEALIAAVDQRQYERLADAMAEDFVDHHAGLAPGVSSREAYQQALEYLHGVLDLHARLELAFSSGDRIVSYVTLLGRHVGEIMGLAPTGNALEWTCIEFYRIGGGRIVERWSIDDMVGLLGQLGADLPH